MTCLRPCYLIELVVASSRAASELQPPEDWERQSREREREFSSNVRSVRADKPGHWTTIPNNIHAHRGTKEAEAESCDRSPTKS